MELFLVYVQAEEDSRFPGNRRPGMATEALSIERARELAADAVRTGRQAFIAQVLERAELPVEYKKLADLGDQP